MPMVPEVSPAELQAELNSGANLVLVDVREADELEISMLPNIVHIPMNDLPERMGELEKDADIVMICRTGNRSGKTTDYLLANGFSRVRNMATGMNGYAATVDPNVKTY